MESARLKNRSAEKADPCVWMQAGVVRRRFCKTGYNCSACGFESALQRASVRDRKLTAITGKRGRIISWIDKMKERPPGRQPCIHYMKRRIGFKLCTHDYRCGNCEFDQFFQDEYMVHTVVRPVNFMRIKGVQIPHGFYLHRGHAWVKMEEDGEVRIGADDFAWRLFGPFERIEAPLIGKQVQQERADIFLKRAGDKTAKMRSPVSGVVTAVNPELRDPGFPVNRDPYAENWIARIHVPDLRQDIARLMIADETEHFLGNEIDRLFGLIEETAGPLTADGGQLGDDIYGKLPQMGWERLTQMFLRT